MSSLLWKVIAIDGPMYFSVFECVLIFDVKLLLEVLASRDDIIAAHW